ncbi:FecR domain-containing protein [Paucibacter sp. PLA-PC-4]|uniref:FecR domain-containing protein n=1 Tax=Paucibacter sp. PLA-PC-4 TaxID=2993655 RepID=UPI003A4C6A0A
MLADGTRMPLNTETRARLALDEARRSATLDIGEVIVEVAKDRLRPFVVHAGGSDVVAARGESRDAALCVVPVEGAVSVQPDLSKSTQARAPAACPSMHCVISFSASRA